MFRKKRKERKTNKKINIDDMSNDIELTLEEQHEIMIIKMTKEQQMQYCQQELELIMLNMTDKQKNKFSQKEKESMINMLLKNIFDLRYF
jgi:hypothetical protein